MRIGTRAAEVTRTGLRPLLWLAFAASAALVMWGLLGGPVRGEVPLTPAPTLAGAPSASTPASTPPTDDAVPSAKAILAPRSREPLPELSGQPVHLEIRQGDDILASAPTPVTQLNGRGELNPEPRMIGWYGPPQWDTLPGNTSAHPGVFAGHVTHGGARDVFYRLGEVRAGDEITVTYSDGTVATFVADTDALTAPKDDITAKADTEYAWVWTLTEPGQRISLFSCDPSQGKDLTGHSRNNWVVQATRTA